MRVCVCELECGDFKIGVMYILFFLVRLRRVTLSKSIMCSADSTTLSSLFLTYGPVLGSSTIFRVDIFAGDWSSDRRSLISSL